MADLLLLIRGGAMPKSCMDCMLNFECRGCMVTGEDWWSDSHVYLDFDPNEERLHSCPLVEIPAHGRLGDLDEFESYVQNQWELNEISNDDWIQFREWLKDQQTIIPASKEGGA